MRSIDQDYEGGGGESADLDAYYDEINAFLADGPDDETIQYSGYSQADINAAQGRAYRASTAGSAGATGALAGAARDTPAATTAQPAGLASLVTATQSTELPAVLQVPASVWARYGVTDPSQLDFKPVIRTEYNGETNQSYDTFDLVDAKTGITLNEGNLGQTTGNNSGQLVLDAQGNLTYQEHQGGGGGWNLGDILSGAFRGVSNIASSDAVRYLAPFVLQGVMPGLNLTPASVGSSLYGLEGTLGKIAGGATLGAGTAALTGGDVTKAALMGGFGGAGDIKIGETGFNVGDLTKAAGVIKSIENDDIFGAVVGATNIADAGNTQIGNTGFTLNEIAKDVNLFKAVASEQPQAIFNALTGIVTQQAALNTKDANKLMGDYRTAGTETTAAGADAFIAAKSVGATDAEALEAANAVTGVVATPVRDGAAALGDAASAYTAIDPEYGDLSGAQAAATARGTVAIGNAEADNPQEAAAAARFRDPNATQFTYGGLTYPLTTSGATVTNAANAAAAEVLRNDIANAPTRSAAYRIARDALGSSGTFTWGGKEYSTATAEERPDLTGATVDTVNAANLARTTDASGTVAAQTDTAARNAGVDATTQKAASAATEKTGFFSNLAASIQNQMKLSSEAANDYLKNNPNSPITNSVSTAMEAAGNLQKNVAGGVALAFDNKPLSDAFVKSGNDLTAFGQSLGSGVVDTRNWNDTMSLLQNANGFEKLGVMAGRIMDGTSGLGRQVEVELRQELPGLFLGGGSVKGIMLATGAMDVAETGGNQALETYDDEIKKGKTHAEALLSARIAGGTAAMTEAALQLTLGKLADFGAGKIGSVGGRAGAKVASEGVIEGAQEGGASLAVNAALGQELDVNKALTQAVAGTAVGKGAAVATTPVDIVTSGANTSTAANLGAIGAVSPGADAAAGAGTAANLGAIGAVSPGADVVAGAGTGTGTITVADAQQAMADLGLNVSNETAVSLATQINAGADAATVTRASTDFASIFLSTGDTSTAASTAFDSAIAAGSDAGTAVAAIIAAASDTGSTANVATALDSTVTTALGSGADVASTVNSAVAAAVDSGVGVNAAVATAANAAATAGVDAATASTAATTAAANTAANTAATVDSTISTSLTAAIDSGVAADAAVTAAVTTAIVSGTDTSTAINSAVTAAVTAGVDVGTATATAVTAAIAAGVDVNTATAAATAAATNANANANAGVTSSTQVDTSTNTATTTATNANTNTSTTVATDANTGATTTTNVNADSNVTTNTVVDPNTNVTTSTVVDANTNTTVNVTLDTATGQVIRVNGPGEVVDPNTVIVDGTAIDLTTGRILTSEEVETRRAAAAEKSKSAAADAARRSLATSTAGLTLKEPTYDAKKSDIAETWLGGQFRKAAPLAGLAALLPQDTPMYQEAQALSALRRASGVEGDSEKPEADYYAYGTEPSFSKVLQPYMTGGAVQKYANGGKIMVSPLMAASGGDVPHKGSHYVQGAGGGQDDLISAKLADGEYVFDADIVAALGDGSNKEGAKKLDAMRESIREHKRGGSIKSIPPKAKSPLAYLKGIL